MKLPSGSIERAARVSADAPACRARIASALARAAANATYESSHGGLQTSTTSIVSYDSMQA